MEIIYIVSGLILGVIITFIWAKSKYKQHISASEIEQKYILREIHQQLEKEVLSLNSELKDKNQEILFLSNNLAAKEQKETMLESRMVEIKEEQALKTAQLKTDFKVLAQEILENNSKKFSEQNKVQIDTILTPFKDKLQQFEKKVEDTYEKGQKDTIGLKAEVKGLMAMNEKLSIEATNLAKALKGDVKMQGNWGEVILERILEKSGLTKNSEYFVQNSITTDEGKRFQPDVIIKLPDNKSVIVDAKVSLVDYERFVNAENNTDQEFALKQHLLSLKTHIKTLSEKNYQNLYGIDGLDFVLLFVPIEGAFTAAVQADNALFQDAFDKNVVLVSTSTLLATLRTIASIWKQEKQTQNAIEIARQGGDLYDKFVAFTLDLQNLGKQMNTATGTYNSAMNKLSEGRGNLIGRAEKMRKLGLKTTKDIDQSLIDRANKKDEIE